MQLCKTGSAFIESIECETRTDMTRPTPRSEPQPKNNKPPRCFQDKVLQKVLLIELFMGNLQLEKRMDAIKDDAEAVKAFGIEFGAEVCDKILKSGLAPGLHFYTLNLEKSTLGIMEKLGLKKADFAIGDETENTFQGTLINTVIKK